MMSLPKNIRFLIGGAIAVVLIVYSLILFSTDESASMYLNERGIDSLPKLVLNGFLGQFFKYKYLGNLVWVAFPFLLIHLAKLKGKSSSIKAFTLIYVLSVLLIAVQGYYNTRYQLSLFPVTISFLVVALFDFLKERNIKPSATIIILGVGLMTVFNYTVFGVEKLLENPPEQTFKPKPVRLPKAPQINLGKRIGALADTLNNKLDRTWPLLIEHDGIEGDRRHIFYQIDSLPFEERILVNNQPLVLYYTNKPGVMYWCRKDLLSTQRGRYPLLESRDNLEVRNYLIDSLQCKYIFSTLHYNEYNPRFVEFLAEQCDTALQEGDYVLYEIR